MPELKLVNSLVDNHYEVRERLGRGSYAEIFIAYDRQLACEVVIKALNTSLQGTPDIDLERTLIENFQNETIALDTVRHPNIILRLGHGTAADLAGVPFHYLVLEYMPGGDLLQLCRSCPGNALKISRALHYFKQVSEALAFAHSKGIIHRDLKPNNFLLSADRNTAKIADFGVAKMTTGEDTEITRVGADLYAPPEHHPNKIKSQCNRLTAAADTYSLAKSFYTVVCGRAPTQFKVDPISYLPNETMKETWAEALLAVLKRATDDDPKKRYSTVVKFWRELALVLPIVEEEEGNEETIIRPRLRVSPGALPNKPVEPEFDPVLASTASHTTYASATPVKRREDVALEVDDQAGLRRERPPKIFIELQQPKPAPPIEEKARQREIEEQRQREEAVQAILRGIEEQRQREEAARWQALQAKINMKKEEQAKLEQALQQEAATEWIVERPVASTFGIALYLGWWTYAVVTTPPAELTGENTLLGQIACYLGAWTLLISPAIHHGVRTWRRWQAYMAETPLVLDSFWKTWVRSPLYWVPLPLSGFLIIVRDIVLSGTK